MRSRVVLPQPDGPSSASHDVEAHLVDRRDRATEALGEVLNGNDRTAVGHAHPLSARDCMANAVMVRAKVTTINTVEAAFTSGVTEKRTIA
jgi:hypothetical protein